MLEDLWRHRRYIVTNAVHDLRTRYAGTSLGWMWAVLPPVFLVVLYGAIFSGVMPVSPVARGGTTVSFALYLASGLLPWMGFADCLSRTSQSLLEAAPYLRKLPISEPVFVAKTAVSSMFGLLISLAILCLISVFVSHWPSPAWLLMLPITALLFLLGFGIGCLLSALTVFFRDVGQALGLVLQIWMWLLPIIYVEEIVPKALQTLFWFNPVYPFLLAFRDAFLEGRVAQPLVWVAMLGWVALFVPLGLMVLHALRADLRDAL